jgi:toxin-antitoxin system PIN domain toxin
VKLVDTNVLVYAVAEDSPHHDRARRWLTDALNGVETVLVPWVSLIGFVRIVSNPRINATPLPADQALGIVDAWLARENVITPEPDRRHASRMREFLEAAGSAGGNLVNDAHLAALALQCGATVVTFDNDFGRFPGVTWEMPSA